MGSAAAAALVLLLSLAATVRCSVKTCEQGQIWARGRELINAMKGQLVLVAFPNAADRATLQKLSSLAEAHPSVRVIALLDPSSCTIEQAAVMGRDWRWLVLDRDDLSSRQRLGLSQDHVALFDRCGRLSRTLPLASTEEVNQAMRAAQHHASCGWCQYGTENGGTGEGAKVDKKLDAFFQQAMVTQPPNQQRAYPHHHQQQQQPQQQHNLQQQQHQQQQNSQHNQQRQQQTNGQQHWQHSQQQGGQPQHAHQQMQMQQHQQQQQAVYHQQQQRQQHQSRNQQQIPPSSPYRTQQQSTSVGQTPGHITHSQIRPQEYDQRGMTIPQYQTTPAPTTTQSADDYGDYDEVMKTDPKTKDVDLRKPAFNEDAQWATASPFHQRRQHKDLFAIPSPTSFSYPSYESSARKAKPTIPSTTVESKKTGAGFDEYADYEDYGAMKTFPNNDEQEEVVQVARSTQTRPRSIDPRSYDPDTQDEDEVPCKAITDDICYHQKKSGRKLSKCCKKGLYIADFCLPGKCSNTTVQACCMQKYLQAKFQCCENPDMDGTTATDAFSRCCHSHFVEEVSASDKEDDEKKAKRDDCCPPEAAAEYWQSVHDICLPNVQADLSTVKFEIRLSDGIRVLDLSETEKWQHECRYGGKRAQYVYVP